MTLPLNIEKYRRHVERFQMSDDQKTELLRAVWSIMENFVDRAFGIDPVQLCAPTGNAERAKPGAPVIESGQSSSSPESLSAAFSTQKRRGEEI